MALDFNDAPEQRNIDVIPAGEICNLQLAIKPGKGGDGGWLKLSKNGESEGLDAEFTVIDGKYAKRKLWQLFTLRGRTANHALAGDISMAALRAIVESARGIKPNDASEAAKAARKINGWADLNGLRFVAQLGVRPAEGTFSAKNFIKEVITPDRSCWNQIEQVPMQPNGNGSGIAPNAASNGSGIAPAADGAAAAPMPDAPPANAVSRPDWMK